MKYSNHSLRLIDRPATFELLPLQVDSELHGDLHQNFDPGQEVCERGEGAARDHRVDVLQAAAVVVGVDAVLDHVQVESDRVWQLQCGEGGEGETERKEMIAAAGGQMSTYPYTTGTVHIGHYL